MLPGKYPPEILHYYRVTYSAASRLRIAFNPLRNEPS
jgi:hypothetical protein